MRPGYGGFCLIFIKYFLKQIGYFFYLFIYKPENSFFSILSHFPL